MKIAFIGVGVMGEAMLSGLLRKRTVSRENIWACDIDPARLAAIKGKYKVNYTPDIRTALDDSEAIVLSVKPQALNSVMNDLRGRLREVQLVVSVVAGATLETLSDGLRHDLVVRVMPNTPAQVSQGISVWTATKAVSPEQKERARTILRALGKEIYVSDEKYIDMATAVSGSGPAYVFLIMEALIDAAVHIGLPRELAKELVLQMVLGSAYMAQKSRKHPAELKNMVTSPGGTTAEGLLCLEEGGLRAILAQAIIAAYEKAQLLGDKIK